MGKVWWKQVMGQLWRLAKWVIEDMARILPKIIQNKGYGKDITRKITKTGVKCSRPGWKQIMGQPFLFHGSPASNGNRQRLLSIFKKL